jgi:hypothetical protein
MSILPNLRDGESMGRNGRSACRHHSYVMVHIGGKFFKADFSVMSILVKNMSLQRNALIFLRPNFWCLNSGGA